MVRLRRRPAALIPLVAFTVALILSLAPSGDRAARAQTPDEEDAPSLLLIMDSSGSMRADDGTGQPKIAAAKEALNAMVDSLPEGAPVGLRVYGHRVPNTDKRHGCKDTELIVPVGPLQPAQMKSRIASFDAKGFTPIGLSLKKGAEDLPAKGERTIVLVSDGIDTCAPPPPCKVAEQITQQGVDLRIDTVGFQVDPRARAELRCIARVAEGSYVDADSAEELAQRLEVISARALRRFDATGTPVVGASATEAAPVLEPGQYTDSIRSGEELFYAVELQPGQSLGASATMVGELLSGDALGVFDLELLQPSLQQAAIDRAVGVGTSARSVGVQTPPVGVDPQDFNFAEAGTYYLRVYMEADVDRRSAAGREFPIELSVEVTGDPIPSPSPAPDDGDDEQAAPPPGGGDDSESLLLLVAGAAAFGLLGAALGTVAGRRVVGWR
jgi:Ca-activated chloride channel family protein